ncbi:hypothetical protein M2140_000025 [Clostridiales Family XIII bacterium PM5-7]
MKFEYQINQDGSATLTRILDPEPFIELPAAIDGHALRCLGDNIVKLGEKSIPREIILPSTVEVIMPYCFNDMRYLKKLVLPDSLQEIGNFGIFTCPDLTVLSIPSSVCTFGTCAFGYMYEHARAYRLNYFTLLCEEHSAAEAYAIKHRIQYQNK